MILANSRHRPGLALAVTLAAQMLGSALLAVPSVIAPAVAPTLGLGAERVGLFVGIAYFAAMVSGLGSGGWVARIGAVGVSQCAMLSFALGTLVAIAAHPLALTLAAVLFGVGYGMLNPASTSLLGHHAPLSNRSLFFSVKQTGVPIGVALAGLLMPWALQALGWQPSVAVAGALCGLLALVLWPTIARLEPQLAARRRGAAATAAATTTATATVAAPAASDASYGLMAVLRNRAVLGLSLMSFTFAFTQLCFITFLVSYLNLALGRSLALAAGILAATQVVSSAARIGWGYVADRWVDPGRLLGALGLAMGASCIGLALLGESASDALILFAAMVCAATAMGWNGVYFAELARHATQREAATMAGASQFFTFSGSMVGPVIFAEIIRQGGSYSGAYAAVAALPIVAGAMMLRSHRRARQT